MGMIRGRHISPGVYTKNTTKDYTAVKTFNKIKPIDTRNVNTTKGSGSFLKWLYFGFFNIKTDNGKITEESLEELKNLTYNELLDLISNNKVIRKRTALSEIDPYEHNEFNIEVTLTEEELNDLLSKGEKIQNILDKNNNCNILVLPTKITDSNKFQIIDLTFDVDITHLFKEINEIKLGEQDYKILCFFGDYWCYSSVGRNKVISPFKVLF